MADRNAIMSVFAQAADNPLDYARKWKADNQRPVVGILPMNFPAELVHAVGALPVILQEDDEPVTVGASRIFNFYCGYNRSLVNQTLSDDFQFMDAIMLGDHCVQILGTADVMRNHMPNVPVLYDQLVSTINAPWAFSESRRVVNFLKERLEETLGCTIGDQEMHKSIKIFNKSRQLMRKLYDLRVSGQLVISSFDVQAIVKSSMIMDREEHTQLLEEFLTEISASASVPEDKIPLYLSGHMCHAPKPELLKVIEDCGGIIVADDLYTGYRYISTDMDESGDPLDVMTNWYLDRNKKVPCPTRSARQYDWDDFLVNAVKTSGAQGVVILMVKFCEPHLYYYPDIKTKFEQSSIPYLMIETEHESMPVEGLKTRLETFMEVARNKHLFQQKKSQHAI